ncbi:MAG TPA: hypothetical protein VMR86_19400 [Myxococcota bacterium]|nr:hypothetical protein [Myxococcota bacterium]
MKAISLLLLALSGCAATAEIRAKPDSICAGRAVRLTWDGSGSGQLTAEPADATLGPSDVAASGQKTVHPKVTTTYRLKVTSGYASKTGEALVKVVSAPRGDSTVRGAVSDEGSGCSPGKIWVTARVDPGTWDPRLRIDEVRSTDGRFYHVLHAAQMAEVGPDAPSYGLRDLPPAGAWKLETPLRPGEKCGEAGAPESLSVALTFICAD